MKNVYLSILKRLKSRGTTRRFLSEKYLKDRPKGYSYCSFCLYLRREREVKIPVGRIEHISGDQMYVDFAAFADHYGCVVFPARVRKPKDKALVDNAVRLLYREVYSKMTGLKFNDLEALNIEIMKHTDALNSRKMYNRGYSRRERFLEVKKDRHGLKSIIITSQLPVESWYDAIGDPTAADAILDRIVHTAHKIELT